jgi:hypothetical protein
VKAASYWWSTMSQEMYGIAKTRHIVMTFGGRNISLPNGAGFLQRRSGELEVDSQSAVCHLFVVD